MIKIIVQSSPFVWKWLIMFDLTKRGSKDENVKLEKEKEMIMTAERRWKKFKIMM
jgi:hypothetical protein